MFKQLHKRHVWRISCSVNTCTSPHSLGDDQCVEKKKLIIEVGKFFSAVGQVNQFLSLLCEIKAIIRCM